MSNDDESQPVTEQSVGIIKSKLEAQPRVITAGTSHLINRNSLVQIVYKQHTNDL